MEHILYIMKNLGKGESNIGETPYFSIKII